MLHGYRRYFRFQERFNWNLNKREFNLLSNKFTLNVNELVTEDKLLKSFLKF